MLYSSGEFSGTSCRVLLTILFRLQEETARVEKSLLEGNFIEAIVQCFNAPKASAFDYNLLEPLQKLLRLSSPVAVSLARPDLFTGVYQKLNHKKAVVRLNLLRIVRSICDPSDDRSQSIRRHKLFEAIEHLAESDSAVLVRNMASDLVKLGLEKDQETSSASRSRSGQGIRRTNSYTPPSLQTSVSTPITPTHASRGTQQSSFVDGSVTPRRVAATSSGDAMLYRPRSREGGIPQMPRRTSAEIAGGSSSTSKSRLPRTSMLRTSRSSISTPTNREEPLMSSRRDNGGRAKEHSRENSREQQRESSRSSVVHGTAPQLNSKRKGRQPSGDIKWS